MLTSNSKNINYLQALTS